MRPTAEDDGSPSPVDGIELGRGREQRASERRSRAVSRAEEDRQEAEALPEGPLRDRQERAVRAHEQAAALHEEAARLHRLHQAHEAQRDDEDTDG